MTIAILIITVLVSVLSFSNRSYFEKLLFSPYKVTHNKQYYRLVTHAFVHADWMHLLVNMLTMFFFGQVIENYLFLLKQQGIIHLHPYFYFTLMYVSAIVISSLSTLKKFKNTFSYNSVGASGAVSTVVFMSIFFEPWQKIYFFFFVPIPGIVFGVLYLWYSSYMSRNNHDNINHDAHFLGALYGFSFPILLNPALFYLFVHQLLNFHF